MLFKTILMLAVVCILNTTISARELDDARQKGEVCENDNGEIEPTEKAKDNPKIKKLVEKVKLKRQEKYKKLAKKHGISLEEAKQRAVEKLRLKGYARCK
jgi:uncharacterized protein YdbL (DUF1318 family)